MVTKIGVLMVSLSFKNDTDPLIITKYISGCIWKKFADNDWC